ncbi:hypothetical protein [Pedobacter panaciterrae]
MPNASALRHQPFVKPDPELMDLVINHLSSYHPLPKALENEIKACLFDVRAKKMNTCLSRAKRANTYISSLKVW